MVQHGMRKQDLNVSIYGRIDFLIKKEHHIIYSWQPKSAENKGDLSLSLP